MKKKEKQINREKKQKQQRQHQPASASVALPWRRDVGRGDEEKKNNNIKPFVMFCKAFFKYELINEELNDDLLLLFFRVRMHLQCSQWLNFRGLCERQGAKPVNDVSRHSHQTVGGLIPN